MVFTVIFVNVISVFIVYLHFGLPLKDCSMFFIGFITKIFNIFQVDR